MSELPSMKWKREIRWHHNIESSVQPTYFTCFKQKNIGNCYFKYNVFVNPSLTLHLSASVSLNNKEDLWLPTLHAALLGLQ